MVIILCASYFIVHATKVTRQNVPEEIYQIGKGKRPHHKAGSLIIQLSDGPFPVRFKVQYAFQILGVLCLKIKGVPKLLTSCKVT